MSGYYGNPNAPSSKDTRIEFQHFSQYAAGDLVYPVVLNTMKFNAIKQAQSTRFTVALVQYQFTNFLDNIYIGNDTFRIIEERFDIPNQPQLTCQFQLTHNIYTLAQLAAAIQTGLNTFKNANGNYTVSVVGTAPLQTINILYTPAGGQLWSFLIPPNPTVVESNLLHALGLQNNVKNVYGVNVLGASYANVYAGLDQMYLTWSPVRYQTMFYNNQNKNPEQLNQVIASLPIMTDSGGYEYEYLESYQYIETGGFPFQQTYEFRLVDENGFLLSSRNGFTFNFTLAFKPFTEEEITQ